MEIVIQNLFTSIIKHCHHNHIYGLQISDDGWVNDQPAITNVIRNCFMDLFTFSLDCSHHDSFSTLGVFTSNHIDFSYLDLPLLIRKFMMLFLG